MTIHTILFPTDFSRNNDAVLDFAAALARDCRSRLLIAHVQEPQHAYGRTPLYYGVPEPSTEELLSMLQDVRPADPRLWLEHRLLTGVHPVNAITRLIEQEPVDLVVMGAHGCSGTGRCLLGSVAEGTSRRAPCPVLICVLSATPAPSSWAAHTQEAPRATWVISNG